jgi:hypothetical protein
VARSAQEDEGWDSFWFEARRDTYWELLSNQTQQEVSSESEFAQEDEGWDSFWFEARRDTYWELLAVEVGSGTLWLQRRKRRRSPESLAAQRSQGSHGIDRGSRRQSGSRRRRSLGSRKDEG